MIPNEVIMILLCVCVVLAFVVGYTMGYSKGNRYRVDKTRMFQGMRENAETSIRDTGEIMAKHVDLWPTDREFTVTSTDDDNYKVGDTYYLEGDCDCKGEYHEARLKEAQAKLNEIVGHMRKVFDRVSWACNEKEWRIIAIKNSEQYVKRMRAIHPLTAKRYAEDICKEICVFLIRPS